MKLETHRIEYKLQLTPELDLEKDVIAFLNSREGGIIYVGVDDNGKPVGIANSDKYVLTIKDRIKNNILPSAMGLFDVLTETIEQKEIIKIIVASGSEKPYFKKKYGMTERGCFIRLGTAAEPMPQSMIDQLYANRTRNSISKIPSPNSSLSFEQLRIYYEEIGISLNKHFKQNLELLTPDGKLNYVGYLVADKNNISIKVARYRENDRVDLIENNEFGYCSLIKACKSVLDKIDIENKVISQITSRERVEKRLWHPIALREAIINAFVHNDYISEIAPKFELFPDRIEITSSGTLPQSLSLEEFFEGYSIPRNKELMRIFKDIKLVEQLGTGVQRILKYYGKECFSFTDNFIRITFPIEKEVIEHFKYHTEYGTEHLTEHDTEHATEQVLKLIKIITGEHSREELMRLLNLNHREYFRKEYLQKAIELNLVELTLPAKPKSIKQKYRLTPKGKKLKESLKNEGL